MKQKTDKQKNEEIATALGLCLHHPLVKNWRWNGPVHIRDEGMLDFTCEGCGVNADSTYTRSIDFDTDPAAALDLVELMHKLKPGHRWAFSTYHNLDMASPYEAVVFWIVDQWGHETSVTAKAPTFTQAIRDAAHKALCGI